MENDARREFLQLSSSEAQLGLRVAGLWEWLKADAVNAALKEK